MGERNDGKGPDLMDLMEEAGAALERLEFVAQALSDSQGGVIHYDGPAASGLVQIIGDATETLREVVRAMGQGA